MAERRHHYEEHEIQEAAARMYREGLATIPIVASRCALLVIDMQNEFVCPGSGPHWVPNATRIVPTLARLIAACRGGGVPVIYTVFSDTHHGLDRPRGLAHTPHGAPWQPARGFDEVWEPLAPRPDEVVIRKPSYGAFYDTPLATILQRLGRDTIVVTGTLTNFCVGTTARQGYERGFFVVVAEDATATDLKEAHDAELATLRRGFAMVCPTDRILEGLGLGLGLGAGLGAGSRD